MLLEEEVAVIILMGGEQAAEQADNAKYKLLDLETLQKEYDKTVLEGKDAPAKLDILSAQRNKILNEQGEGAFGSGPKNAGLDPAQAKAKALELTTTKEELARYDRNHDGKLDAAERARMDADKKK